MGGQGSGVDEEFGGAGAILFEGDDDMGAASVFGVEPQIVRFGKARDEFVVSRLLRPTQIMAPVCE